MRTKLLSKLSFVLTVMVVMAACSPVKIANIEKRRYRDGYYVDLKKRPTKAEDIAVKNAHQKQELSYASSDDFTTKKSQKKEAKQDAKALKNSLKNGDTELNTQKLIAAMEKLSDKAIPFDLKKNQSSVPKREQKRLQADSFGPSLLNIDGMERSAFILLVVVVVLLLILMKDITAILVAVLLVLLILFLLRQLEIINW